MATIPPPSSSGDTGSTPGTDPHSGESGRRRFLAAAWYFLGGALLLEAGWIAAGFFRPRRGRHEAGASIVVAGPVDRFEKGSVTAFQNGGFYLARLDDGGFLAMSRECTHLGCTVGWDAEQGRFVCPCHASVYAIDGAVLKAPAPRPLDLFPVRIENRIVKVDVSRARRRSTFTADQEART